MISRKLIFVVTGDFMRFMCRFFVGEKNTIGGCRRQICLRQTPGRMNPSDNLGAIELTILCNTSRQYNARNPATWFGKGKMSWKALLGPNTDPRVSLKREAARGFPPPWQCSHSTRLRDGCMGCRSGPLRFSCLNTAP